MKQRIILSEKQRTPVASHEHALRRSTRFPEAGVAGAPPLDGINRPGILDRDFEFQRRVNTNDGFSENVTPFSPSTFRPERFRSGLRGHAETTQSIAEYREQERMFTDESVPYNFALDIGSPTPGRHQRTTRDQRNRSSCFNLTFENVCPSKGKHILQLLCVIGLMVLALRFTSNNGDLTKGSRSILYDALPWVFRATNISAQQTRAKALWENHIVLSDDNRILIPETFESRWNIEVAPLLENQLHRIWDELPSIECPNDEQAYAGFSLKESESLPATVSSDSECNYDASVRNCAHQKPVADLRHLSINLPSKWSRSSYSVNIMVKRSVGPSDVTVDPEDMFAVARGIIQFHLSDSSQIALIRYCSDQRHHFSDSIVPRYTGSNKVGVISLYELKRMYALTSRNRRGASYFTELWDANELSRATFDTLEHSWHQLTKSTRKRLRGRKDYLDTQVDKPSDISLNVSETVQKDGEIGSNPVEVGSTTEDTNANSTRISGPSQDMMDIGNSSIGDPNQKNPNDLPNVSLQRERDKHEFTFSETVSEPKIDGNEEQRETQDEDEVPPDIPSEAEEPEEDEDSSTDSQGPDESGERKGNSHSLQNKQLPESRQDSTVSETTDSKVGSRPHSSNVPPSEGEHENPSGIATTVATHQYPARVPPSQVDTGVASSYQEHRLPNQGYTSEFDHERTTSQSSQSPVRDAEVPQQFAVSHQIPRQQEPAFPRTPHIGTPSQASVLPGGNAVMRLEQSELTNNPRNLPSSPQTNANGFPSQEAPLQVGNTDQALESSESTHIPLRNPSPARTDQLEVPPQETQLRYGSKGPQQERPHYAQTVPNDVNMHQMEIPLQGSLMSRKNAEDERSVPSNGGSLRIPILPRAHHVTDIRNRVTGRRESRPQIHRRGTFEETRDSVAVTESKVTAPIDNQQPNRLQEGLVSRDASFAISAPRVPQGVGTARRSHENTLIKPSASQNKGYVN